MPVTVRCAVCEATTVLQTSKEVYGDKDPLGDSDEVVPITNRTQTGWRSQSEALPEGQVARRVFCPLHAAEPETLSTKQDAWSDGLESAVKVFTQAWALKHPAPTPDWKPWDRA